MLVHKCFTLKITIMRNLFFKLSCTLCMLFVFTLSASAQWNYRIQKMKLVKVQNVAFDKNEDVVVKSTTQPKGQFGYFSFNDDLTCVYEHTSANAKEALHCYKIEGEEWEPGKPNIYCTQIPYDHSLRNLILFNMNIILTDRKQMKVFFYTIADN